MGAGGGTGRATGKALRGGGAQKVAGAEPKGEKRLTGAPAGGGGGMCHGRERPEEQGGAVVVGVEEEEEMVEVRTVVLAEPP